MAKKQTLKDFYNQHRIIIIILLIIIVLFVIWCAYDFKKENCNVSIEFEQPRLDCSEFLCRINCVGEGFDDGSLLNNETEGICECLCEGCRRK